MMKAAFSRCAIVANDIPSYREIWGDSALYFRTNDAASLADAKKQGAVLAYGNFITIVVNFAIIAFVLFLVVKGINSMKKKEEAAPAAPPAPTKSEVLLTEIRDALVKR